MRAYLGVITSAPSCPGALRPVTRVGATIIGGSPQGGKGRVVGADVRAGWAGVNGKDVQPATGERLGSPTPKPRLRASRA
jgi:hypothetical protein